MNAKILRLDFTGPKMGTGVLLKISDEKGKVGEVVITMEKGRELELERFVNLLKIPQSRLHIDTTK